MGADRLNGQLPSGWKFVDEDEGKLPKGWSFVGDVPPVAADNKPPYKSRDIVPPGFMRKWGDPSDRMTVQAGGLPMDKTGASLAKQGMANMVLAWANPRKYVSDTIKNIPNVVESTKGLVKMGSDFLSTLAPVLAPGYISQKKVMKQQGMGTEQIESSLGPQGTTADKLLAPVKGLYKYAQALAIDPLGTFKDDPVGNVVMLVGPKLLHYMRGARSGFLKAGDIQRAFAETAAENPKLFGKVDMPTVMNQVKEHFDAKNLAELEDVLKTPRTPLYPNDVEAVGRPAGWVEKGGRAADPAGVAPEVNPLYRRTGPPVVEPIPNTTTGPLNIPAPPVLERAREIGPPEWQGKGQPLQAVENMNKAVGEIVNPPALPNVPEQGIAPPVDTQTAKSVKPTKVERYGPTFVEDYSKLPEDALRKTYTDKNGQKFWADTDGKIYRIKPETGGTGEIKGLGIQFLDENKNSISYSEFIRRQGANGGEAVNVIKSGRPAKEIVLATARESEIQRTLKESADTASKVPLVPPIDVDAPGFSTATVLNDLRGKFAQGLKGSVMGPGKYALDRFSPPSRVLGKSEAGARIWEATDIADLNKGGWLYRKGNQLHTFVDAIHEGSPLDTGVFKVRNNHYNLGEILKSSDTELISKGFKPEEIRAMRKNPGRAGLFNDFLQKEFDSMLREWGKSRLATQEEAAAWNASAGFRGRGESAAKAAYVKGLPENVAEVFDLYTRRIEDYIPHMFDRGELVTQLKSDLAKLNNKLKKADPNSPQTAKLIENIKEYQSSILDLEGGKAILYKTIPSNVRMKFFERRTSNRLGYEVSAIKAYRAYVTGLAKKMFDEPALKSALRDFNELPHEMKPYVTDYLRRFAGLDRTPLDSLYGSIKSIMWLRLLGFNPRSAIVNLTQRLNTIADMGPEASLEGWRHGFTPEGNAAFARTGLGQSIPQVMMGTETPASGFAAVQRAAGWMFSKAEEGNLKHAFLTKYLAEIKKGTPEAVAMREGVKFAEKTQFRYGRTGMPLAMKGMTGLALQFWSYPINQVMFLFDMAKRNPAKFIGWLGMAEGTNIALQELLNMDLSNSVGLGFNYAEILEAIKSISDGDFRKFALHAKQGMGGGGLVPYGLGPAFTAAGNVTTAFRNQNSEFDTLLGQFEPVGSVRIRQAVGALQDGPNEEGKYPIRHPYSGEMLYRETPWELAQRTFGPKPYSETKEQRAISLRKAEDLTYASVRKQINEAFAEGKTDKALNLISKYKIPIKAEDVRDAIKQSMLRKSMTRGERMKTPRSEAGFLNYMENR